MRHHRLTRSATLGLALVALVAPTAAAQAQDLRTPDARDASSNAGTVSPALPADLRSPDARETVNNAVTGGPTDLRTADARDAADGRGTFNAPEVALIKVPQPSPVQPAAWTGVTRASAPGPSWSSSCSDSGVSSRSCIAGTAHRLTAAPRSADTRSRIHA